MSDKLKIMVRETKTERRALTRVEAYAMATAGIKYPTPEMTWNPTIDDARAFLRGHLFVCGSYINSKKAPQWGKYGSAEFAIEDERDAAPEEVDAWHALQIGYIIADGFAAWNIMVDDAKHILKDKEIILEVIYDK
jgi:hypothetical protein